MGFFDELDAASGARGYWRWDPGGYDDDAGDVRSEVPGVARPGMLKRVLWMILFSVWTSSQT